MYQEKEETEEWFVPLGADDSTEGVLPFLQVRQGGLILKAVSCLPPVVCFNWETLGIGAADIAVSASQNKA